MKTYLDREKVDPYSQATERYRFDRVAPASRVLVIASSRSRTFPVLYQFTDDGVGWERLFRRDAETSTRDACATHNPREEAGHSSSFEQEQEQEKE
jgi:hypothetical protein